MWIDWISMKEPLEGALRARFGQIGIGSGFTCSDRALRGGSKGSVWSIGKGLVLLALIEPLEGALRARFGQ